MEERRKNWTLWIILAIVVGLLLSCSLGALAGGFAGYFAGQKAARQMGTFDRRFDFRFEPWPSEPMPQLPEPRIPEELPFRDEREGALLIDVVEDSPADRAGLRVGDIIFEIDGDPLVEARSLSDRISQHDSGDRIELRISRGGRESTVQVKLGRDPGKGGETPWLGVTYRTIPWFRFGTWPRLRVEPGDPSLDD